MGFFSFLSGPEVGEDDELEKLRKEQREMRNYKPSEPDAGEILSESKPGPMSEFKSYPQRRGETSSKVFETADKIINKFEKMSPELKYDAEQARRDVRAKPDDAAKILEKFYKNSVSRAMPSQTFEQQGTGFGGQVMPGLYDQDFATLENHVRGIRTMKRGAEEKALSGQLGDVDLKKNLSELQNLKGQLDTLTKEIATAKDTMPEAVSQYGEQQNAKALAGKQQQAAAIAEHVKQLESVTKQPTADQPTGDQPGTAEPVMPPPLSPTPVTHFLGSLGIPNVLPQVQKALQKVGIPAEEWGKTNVDPSAGMMRVMAELDPNGDFARLIATQLANARTEDATQQQNKGAGGDKAQTDAAIMRTERAIQTKEGEMRALYATLRESPFMKTWPGIILYCIVGMLTQNPAFAARLIGGVGNREAVKEEISGIQFELRRLDHELARREQSQVYSQREAARRLQKKEDTADQRKWETSKMMLQHQLIIKRNAARGNPETALMKKLAGDFQRNLGMASKFSGEMQNEFADPKDRAAARANFNLYMRRAAELDGDIRKIGGAGAEPEPEAQE